MFKIGDKVRLKARVGRWDGRWDGVLMVTRVTDKFINAGRESDVFGCDGWDGTFALEALELIPEVVEPMFKIGDKVRLKDRGRWHGSWDGTLTVIRASNFDKSVIARRDYEKREGFFDNEDLELIPEPYHKFKVGDMVQLKESEYPDYSSKFRIPMKVIGYGLVFVGWIRCEHPTAGACIFDPESLELAPEVVEEYFVTSGSFLFKSEQEALDYVNSNDIFDSQKRLYIAKVVRDINSKTKTISEVINKEVIVWE